MKKFKVYLVSCFLLLFTGIHAQEIPSEKVVPTKDLVNYLNADVRKELGGEKAISEAILAQYLREKFSKRYFYDWKTFDSRFANYNAVYPSSKQHRIERAEDHLSKYSGRTKWKLPFDYLTGDSVDAYALRHLARQHKMVNRAYYYNYQDKYTKYLDYFTSQLQSLN